MLRELKPVGNETTVNIDRMYLTRTAGIETDFHGILPPMIFSNVSYPRCGNPTKIGAVAHVTAPLLFVESKNKKHGLVKIKACATDFLENQKFSMDL